MGTLLGLTLPWAPAETTRTYVSLAFDTARICERVMSRHDPTSDLSRLNRLAGQGAIRAPALTGLLGVARRQAERTGGAFDPTVEPLLELWRRAHRSRRPPSPRALAGAVRLVSWREIRLRGSAVGLARAGMALDLGAIGKGLTLDLIAERLRRAGCRSALLNFGESSLLAIGPASDARWRVLLRHPRGGFAGELTLRDGACSTSATLGQTIRVGRRRLGHIVDPRTGQPLRALAQATVLAPSAAVAESLSTALLVVGRAQTEELARRSAVEACWIDPAGCLSTPRFPLTAGLRDR